MVLRKSCRVLRKYKPRSILLESKEVPDHVLLFESDIIAALSTPKQNLSINLKTHPLFSPPPLPPFSAC